MQLRNTILSEVRRLAEANEGRPPGKKAFERATGIMESRWCGVFWARWSDVVIEAGYQPNKMQERSNEDVLLKVIEVVRHYGRVPTSREMSLYRRKNPTFPGFRGAITTQYPTRAALISALQRQAATDSTYADIATMLPSMPASIEKKSGKRAPLASDGWVYLIKSGNHYKIGRGENLERRVKEIRVALPEAGALVHAIRTDDPAGIEAYWHRRFADRRANGEWFRLSTDDLSAFKKRKFQ